MSAWLVRAGGHVDRNLVDLEVKVAYLERHLVELDEVVQELAQEVSMLRRELAFVQERLEGSGELEGD